MERPDMKPEERHAMVLEKLAQEKKENERLVWNRIIERAVVFGIALLLVFAGKMICRYLYNSPFPAVPDLITEAELQEISDYIVSWQQEHPHEHWQYDIDCNGDGVDDVEVRAFVLPKEDKEIYTRTSLYLPSLKQLLTGHPFALAREEMVLEDGWIGLGFIVTGPTAGDRSELRLAVAETLDVVREEVAAAE